MHRTVAEGSRAVGRTGRVVRPAARGQDLLRLGRRGVHVHGPDRGPWHEIRFGASVRAEGDGPTIRMPGDIADAPVAAGRLARLRPWAGLDDEQVRPAIAMALLVPTPVGPRDVPRAGGVLRGRADPPHRTDEKPGGIHLSREGQSSAIG